MEWKIESAESIVVLSGISFILIVLARMIGQLMHVVLVGTVCLLTHCGLVTPYDSIDLGQHWLR